MLLVLKHIKVGSISHSQGKSESSFQHTINMLPVIKERLSRCLCPLSLYLKHSVHIPVWGTQDSANSTARPGKHTSIAYKTAEWSPWRLGENCRKALSIFLLDGLNEKGESLSDLCNCLTSEVRMLAKAQWDNSRTH